MKIAVLGAGSVGVYVGGALLLGGAELVLIGRARMRERLQQHGLKLTDLHGWSGQLPAAAVPYSEDPAALAGAGLIIVAVKSADTAVAAQAILHYADPTALVLSLQNGVGNVEQLRAVLGQTVLAGMVPFNVLQLPDGRLLRGTAGDLMVEAHPDLAPWHAAFIVGRVPLREHDDFAVILWGKLLINLNNVVNALSGLPLRAELSQRAYRRCFAMLMSEGLMVLKAAGIAPAKVVAVGPSLLPWMLRLPDFLFRRIAAPMLRMDPAARSSMWEDLQAGRRTEIDYLNGALVQLAHSCGVDAPANRRAVALMRAAEAGTAPAMSGSDLLAALRGRAPALAS